MLQYSMGMLTYYTGVKEILGSKVSGLVSFKTSISASLRLRGTGQTERRGNGNYKRTFPKLLTQGFSSPLYVSVFVSVYTFKSMVA